MITVYLSPESLEAARAVDPNVSPAAVHAAVEIAVVEQLRAVADRTPDEIRARAKAIEERD
jgi:post-segregation antitoxin (ccd killing protein)